MRIQNKLFAALLIFSLLLVGIMFVLMRWSIDRGMLDYVNTREAEKMQPFISDIAELYGKNKSWQGLKDNRRQFRELLMTHNARHFLPPPDHNLLKHLRDGNSPRDGNPMRRIMSQVSMAVLDQQHQLVVGRLNPKHKLKEIPIIFQGQTVGWLTLTKRSEITEGFALQFLEKQQEAFIMISLIVICLAAALSILLSKHFVRPIDHLAKATMALTHGDYEQKLLIDRSDELGQLARDFNELATTLAHNDSSRKRWLADTSHELRTPLAILRGELEAMIDGVRPINLTNIRSAQQEVMHLSKLVDDLYQLSNADIGGLRYRKQTLDLNELLLAQISHHQMTMLEAQLSCDYKPCTQVVPVHGDSTRLNQLFDNLLGNSCKYTQTGGKILIELTVDEHEAVINIDDSAPGVPEDALPRLFDHLFRVEDSRNRSTGGSGLGMAICQRIVEAHEGSISAGHSPLGGLRVHLTLPLLQA